MLTGLAQLNLEITNKCDKPHKCAFCGHQDQAIHPITYEDMEDDLLERIVAQLCPGIVISFHRDGDPLAHPRLGQCLDWFKDFTTSVVTHGLFLYEKRYELVDNATTCTVSVFRGDPDHDAQLEALTSFLAWKGTRLPRLQIKIVGDLSDEEARPYYGLHVPILRRLIHVPLENSKYAHRMPTMPEVGVCLDALHRPSIAADGRMYLCNRLDPHHVTCIGDLRHETLEEIWMGRRRLAMVAAHKNGRRDQANPLCAVCQFWGVASE